MTKSGSDSKSPDIAARERLLTAATELFSRKGYSATTTREIVAAAGVTKPVLYYYFRNKEGIYLELIRGAFAKFDALLDAFRDERGSVTERLLRLSDQVFSLFMENIGVARLMYSIYYGPPQGAPFFDFDAFHFKFHDMIQQLLEEGIRRGEFRKENLEEMTWESWEQSTSRWSLSFVILKGEWDVKDSVTFWPSSFREFLQAKGKRREKENEMEICP